MDTYRTYSYILFGSQKHALDPPPPPKRPLLSDTGIIPAAGQRILMIGGRESFAHFNIPDDAYGNDDIWREAPLKFPERALTWLTSSENSPLIPLCPSTGLVLPLHVHRVKLWPLLQRSQCADVTRLTRIDCGNVQKFDRPRKSVQLGPGGCIGLDVGSISTPDRAADSLPDTDSIADEDFIANNTRAPVNH